MRSQFDGPSTWDDQTRNLQQYDTAALIMDHEPIVYVFVRFNMWDMIL